MSPSGEGMAKRIFILDTTLRDGEQGPGCSLSFSKKVEVAQALARLGVDVLEAGFPACSAGEFRAVQHIAQTIGQGSEGLTPIICALARARVDDIQQAWEAIREAQHPRLHLSLPTSPIHLRHKLRIRESDLLQRVRDMVSHARTRCEDIEFGAEDASRTPPDLLCRVFEEAIGAGATWLNLPDTVGYATPEEFGALVRVLKEQTPGMARAHLSVHCHDDLGLATANTLAGVLAGAEQVEVTVNGLGERAGNASLEEVVVALPLRLGFETGIRLTNLAPTSRQVAACTGISVPPNKAIVGANAFAHQSGIHQDGLLKAPETYEILDPQTVGAPMRRLVLGKHSGRHALFARLEAQGIQVPKNRKEALFARFKQMAEQCSEVDDTALRALVESPVPSSEVISLQLSARRSQPPSPTSWRATLELRRKGQPCLGIGEAAEVPEAILNAFAEFLGFHARLKAWRLWSEAAQQFGEVELEDGRQGCGQAPEPMLALARACLNACEIPRIEMNETPQSPFVIAV